MNVKVAEPTANLKAAKTDGRFFGLLATLVLGLAAFLTIFIEIVAPVNWKQTDITPTVIGLREVVQRHNPYTRELTSHIQRLVLEDTPGITEADLQAVEKLFRQPFNYPLPQALLWVPLAVPFPEVVSVALMRFATLAGYFGGVLLFCMAFNSRQSYPGRSNLPGLSLLIILTAVAGGATLRTLWPIVQPAGITMLYLGLFTYFFIRGRYEWAGAMACIMLYKPQLTAVLFLGVLCFALINPLARWRMFKGFLAATLPLSALAFFFVPSWPLEWLKVLGWLTANDETTHIEYISALGFLGWLVAGLVVLLNIWVWWRAARTPESDPERTFQLGLALSVGIMSSLFLLPRTGSYDYIACYLPLTFSWGYIAAHWKQPWRNLSVGLGLLILYGASLYYLQVQGNEIFAAVLALSALYTGGVQVYRKIAVKG